MFDIIVKYRTTCAAAKSPLRPAASLSLVTPHLTAGARQAHLRQQRSPQAL